MTTMDTILVVNGGSSSVKFQVFAVDGDGRLRRQIKGQMDGIGSRPRLRASGATGEALADREMGALRPCALHKSWGAHVSDGSGKAQ
jgi:acetate kinase